MKTLKLKNIDIVKKSLGVPNPKVYYLPKHVMRYVHDFGTKVKDPIFSKEDMDTAMINQEGTIKVFQTPYLKDSTVIMATVTNDDPTHDYSHEIIGFINKADGGIVPIGCLFKIITTHDTKFYSTIGADSNAVEWYKVNFNMTHDVAEGAVRQVGSEMFNIFVLIDLFMRTVKIETVEVPKKCKSRRARVYNKSDMNLTVVGSDWYQSMVLVGDSFVTGHWRNQSYGPERSLRRLIYIEPHKRGSYTRRAKKQLDPMYA